MKFAKRRMKNGFRCFVTGVMIASIFLQGCGCVPDKPSAQNGEVITSPSATPSIGDTITAEQINLLAQTVSQSIEQGATKPDTRTPVNRQKDFLKGTAATSRIFEGIGDQDAAIQKAGKTIKEINSIGTAKSRIDVLQKHYKETSDGLLAAIKRAEPHVKPELYVSAKIAIEKCDAQANQLLAQAHESLEILASDTTSIPPETINKFASKLQESFTSQLKANRDEMKQAVTQLCNAIPEDQKETKEEVETASKKHEVTWQEVALVGLAIVATIWCPVAWVGWILAGIAAIIFGPEVVASIVALFAKGSGDGQGSGTEDTGIGEDLPSNLQDGNDQYFGFEPVSSKGDTTPVPSTIGESEGSKKRGQPEVFAQLLKQGESWVLSPEGTINEGDYGLGIFTTGETQKVLILKNNKGNIENFVSFSVPENDEVKNIIADAKTTPRFDFKPNESITLTIITDIDGKKVEKSIHWKYENGQYVFLNTTAK